MHTNKGKGRGPCGFNLALPSPARVAKTHRKAISLLILAEARPRARARLAQSVLGQVVENPTHARGSRTTMLGGGAGEDARGDRSRPWRTHPGWHVCNEVLSTPTPDSAHEKPNRESPAVK